MLNRRMLGLLRLFRFELPFTAGVCVVLGELLALGRLPSAREIILGFLSIFFISATALILNDYFDIETDKINSPERPLPSGMVTRRDVVILSIVVALLGFATSFMIGADALITAMLVWAVGFLYNWRFKKTGFVGNLLVSFSVGMTFIFGGIAVGMPFQRIVWFFGVMVMLIDLGEEIAADAMDMHGDRHAGSRSLALIFGQQTALKISAGIFLLVVAISSLPFVLGWLQWIFFVPISIMDAVIIYSTIRLLDTHTADRRKYIRSIYLGGLAAIVIFLFMRIAT